MTFDIATLAFARGVVAFVGGCILLMNWWQGRTAWAALWWAIAACGAGAGIILLALHDALPSYASTIIAPLTLDLCGALSWIAARIFNRGSVRPAPVVAAIGGWMALLVVTGLAAGAQRAIALGVAITACLYAASAFEFYLARGEKLRGRWPMITLLGLEAIALFLAAVQYSASSLTLPTLGWFGIIHFVGLVYAGGSVIFLVMMLNDRSEAKHKAAALTDPLTGLPNRRAFMDLAHRMIERGLREAAPISLLAFDLDRFKKINDTFGHPTGDHVLRIFTDVLPKAMRPGDVAGRIGGEEFAVLLPGCRAEAALVIARRIRGAFEDDAQFVNGRAIGATLSVGVATAPDHGACLADIIASADGALYRAKDLGRNRVMLAEGDAPGRDSAAIVRIA